MELPPVQNPILEEKNNVTYIVLAYRELSVAERIRAVQVYHGQKRSKKKDKNCTIQIITMFGLQGT